MIFFREGKMIDTCNMANNQIYTYVLDKDTLYKVEVNFNLYDIENFLKRIKTLSELKEEKIDEIEFDTILKRPVPKHPYDEIIYFSEDKTLKENLIENKKKKNVYLKWIQYPNVYYDIKDLIEFKTQKRIGQIKHVDLNYYLSLLDEIGLKKEFLDMLTFEIKETIDKKHIETIANFSNNSFLCLQKPTEDAKMYLEYGDNNRELIKKLRKYC